MKRRLCVIILSAALLFGTVWYSLGVYEGDFGGEKLRTIDGDLFWTFSNKQAAERHLESLYLDDPQFPFYLISWEKLTVFGDVVRYKESIYMNEKGDSPIGVKQSFYCVDQSGTALHVFICDGAVDHNARPYPYEIYEQGGLAGFLDAHDLRTAKAEEGVTYQMAVCGEITYLYSRGVLDAIFWDYNDKRIVITDGFRSLEDYPYNKGTVMSLLLDMDTAKEAVEKVNFAFFGE